MSELVIGVSAYANANLSLMESAGIDWVRVGFPYPFSSPDDRTPTPEYYEARRNAIAWAERGFWLMATTPQTQWASKEPIRKTL